MIGASESPQPLDPDEEDASGRTVRVRHVLIVALGGAVGTSVRACATLAAHDAFWVVAVINLVGAFALGLLLEVLSIGGADVGSRRTVRLGLGTGVIGGFTTYSALSYSAAGAMGSERWLLVGWLVLELAVGVLAAAAGTRIARLIWSR